MQQLFPCSLFSGWGKERLSLERENANFLDELKQTPGAKDLISLATTHARILTATEARILTALELTEVLEFTSATLVFELYNHVVGHASQVLHRLRSDPKRWVPLWKSKPKEFLLEQARLSSPWDHYYHALLPESIETEVGGSKIRFNKSTRVSAWISSANMDPSVFEHPTRFNPDRTNLDNVLPFSLAFPNDDWPKSARSTPWTELQPLIPFILKIVDRLRPAETDYSKPCIPPVCPKFPAPDLISRKGPPEPSVHLITIWGVVSALAFAYLVRELHIWSRDETRPTTCSLHYGRILQTQMGASIASYHEWEVVVLLCFVMSAFSLKQIAIRLWHCRRYPL